MKATLMRSQVGRYWNLNFFVKLEEIEKYFDLLGFYGTGRHAAPLVTRDALDLSRPQGFGESVLA